MDLEKDGVRKIEAAVLSGNSRMLTDIRFSRIVERFFACNVNVVSNGTHE